MYHQLSLGSTYYLILELVIKNNPLPTHSSAFSEPLFRRYFPASCFATLGGWIIRFLLGWSSWELTHSAFWVGIVAGVMLLPTFLFSPLFGIVSDRINPRNGLMLSVFSQGVIAALACVTSAFEMLSLGVLIGFATLLGIITSAHTPIRLALIPRLVPRQALPSAIGYGAMLFNSSRVIGPAVGAWLVAGFSQTAAFFVASCLCFLAMPILFSIKGINGKSREREASFLNELKAGFIYTASHPLIRMILALTLLNGILGRTLLELLPALSGQLLNGSAQTLAILSAIAGTGSIMAGLFVSRQSGDENKLFRLVYFCLVTASLSLFIIQWLSGLYQLCALIFTLSMLTTIAGTGGQALTQLMVDDSYRGRVMSLWSMLSLGSPAIGAIAIGALAQSWGFPLTSAVVGIIALVLLAILRRLSKEAPPTSN